MPYRKSYSSRSRTVRRRYRPKRNGRRRRYGRRSVVRVRHVSGFPDSMVVNLKYSQAFVSTASPLSLQQFRGNGVFDPDFTGTGHQPMMFDQYAAVYDRYIVYGSSCQVVVTSNAANTPHYVVMLPSVSSTLPYSTIEDFREASHSKFTLLGTRDGIGTVSLYNKISTKKIRGETTLDDSFGALVTTNPQRQWFWSITASLADLSIGTVNLNYIVTLNYRVKFHKRKNVVGS